MKGILILLGDVYRNAGALKKGGITVSHANGASAPVWLFGETSAIAQSAINQEQMSHEVANAIVCDLDTKEVYFERLHPSTMHPFDGDDWFDPIVVASDPQDFARKMGAS